MTWDAFHRRDEVLRNVVHEADRRRDGVLPLDVPGVAETFEDELALVAALQLRWHTRLAGRIERALMDRPTDPETAVLTAWRGAASDAPGLRQVLDACVAHPSSPEMAEALERARRKEWLLLSAMAGRAGAAEATAVRVGRELEEQARAAYDPTVGPRHRRDDQPGSLLDRLKAHIAV
jgi:hypothetical protein